MSNTSLPESGIKNRQCTPGSCIVDQPYEKAYKKEIWAGGIICGGCGRTIPNQKYILASSLSLQTGEQGVEEVYVEVTGKENPKEIGWYIVETFGGRKLFCMV